MSAPVKLAGFLALGIVVFALAVAMGRLVGPVGNTPHDASSDTSGATHASH